MGAEGLSGGSGGDTGTVGHLGCDTLGCGGGVCSVTAFLLLCQEFLQWGAGLMRGSGELSPLGSHPLPSLVNPHHWISATAWWFGLFVSYKVQSHRT